MWDPGEREGCADAHSLAVAVTQKVTAYEEACQRALAAAAAKALEAQEKQQEAARLVAETRKQIDLLRRAGGAQDPATVNVLRRNAARLVLLNDPSAAADGKRALDDNQALDGKQAPEGKRGALTSPAAAAQARIDSLAENDRISIFYEDEQWCSAFVIRLTAAFVWVLWDCTVAGCPANSAKSHHSVDALCTHGEHGQNGRSAERRPQKTKLVSDLQAGEMKIGQEE